MAGPWLVTRECINTCSWPTWCWKNNVAAYDGLCTGYWKFNFGKQVEKRGNFIVAAEETQNEMDIRLTACKQQMGKNDGKFKIYKRGLEQDLKLVNFSKEKAYQTKQYKQLENTIKNKNINI